MTQAQIPDQITVIEMYDLDLRDNKPTAVYAAWLRKYFETPPGRSCLKGITIDTTPRQVLKEIEDRKILGVASKTKALPGLRGSEKIVYDPSADERGLNAVWIAEATFAVPGIPDKYKKLLSIYTAMPYQAPNRLDGRSLIIDQGVSIGYTGIDLDAQPHLLSSSAPRESFEDICKPYPLNKTDNYLFTGDKKVLICPGGDDQHAKVKATHKVMEMAMELANRHQRNLIKAYTGF